MERIITFENRSNFLRCFLSWAINDGGTIKFIVQPKQKKTITKSESLTNKILTQDV